MKVNIVNGIDEVELQRAVTQNEECIVRGPCGPCRRAIRIVHTTRHICCQPAFVSMVSDMYLQQRGRAEGGPVLSETTKPNCRQLLMRSAMCFDQNMHSADM